MEALTKIKTNWNHEELKAYTLIYCMNADVKVIDKEVETILSSVNESIYEKMVEEFSKDNDFESIQKISNTVKDLNYTKDQIQSLFDEIRKVFYADNELSIMERNIALGLKRVLGF
ncbi:hypothetical protein [Tenacibaculum sp. M341]|uniref:hypothetical protein n=1 Tax=Tenacibaculum sp. M341 TaxID=2530339 RepID=UPI0010482098|nr:hypothetical protein [Tenacibaculum sp. M341]TCI94143.1 hypothetical protein EYW44_02020 [Tenacibaculum sp. M341]